MLRDGSLAWEVKDFLVAQERCVDVTVEGQVFPGKAAKKDNAKNKQQNEVNAKKKSKKKAESKNPDLEGNSASHLKQELWWISGKPQVRCLLGWDIAYFHCHSVSIKLMRGGRNTWRCSGLDLVLWVLISLDRWSGVITQFCLPSCPSVEHVATTVVEII